MAIEILDTYYVSKNQPSIDIKLRFHVFEDGDVALEMNNLHVLYILKNGTLMIASGLEEQLTTRKLPNIDGHITIVGLINS